MSVRRKCAVINCDNYSGSALGRSFFRFPNNATIRKKWIVFCRREKGFDPKRSAVVCMDHFTIDDFQNNMQIEMGLAERRKLKNDAVPTIQRLSPHNLTLQEEREKRIQKRAYKKIVEALLKEHDTSSSVVYENENLEDDEDTNKKENASEKNERIKSEFPAMNGVHNDPFETTEILIERIPKSEIFDNEIDYLHESEEDLSCVESMENEGYDCLETEVKALRAENEGLKKDNLRLQDTEKKYLKYLSAIKKKYLTTLKTAHTKYLESEDKYLQEIRSLKERLEKAEYEKSENNFIYLNDT